MAFLSGFVESVFFNLDRRDYWMPWHYGLKYEVLECDSDSMARIKGLYIPQQKEGLREARGSVLFFHSANFNMQYALAQVAYLAQEGFDVVLFDYSGSGYSTGETSLEAIRRDGEAVLSWMREKGLTERGLAFYGQGVGCDPLLKVLEAHPEDVRGVILESAYASRRGWLKDRYGPVVGDYAARVSPPEEKTSAQILSQLTLPVVLIYPQKDSYYLHKAEPRRLIEVAPEQAEVWKVPGKKFLAIFGGARNEWHGALVRFLREQCFPGVHAARKDQPAAQD